MISKQEIFTKINDAIREENGVPITIDAKLIDSELDSLGITIVLIILDTEFSIFKDNEDVDIPNVTMRELVSKCKISLETS